MVSFDSEALRVIAISSAQARVATISAPPTSALPKEWSPFEWVFTSVPMRAARGSAARIASSIARVRRASNSVATSIQYAQREVNNRATGAAITSDLKVLRVALEFLL